MDYKALALNAISLGGHGKLELADAAYEAVYGEYLSARAQYDAAYTALVSSVTKLGNLTSLAVTTLAESYEIMSYTGVTAAFSSALYGDHAEVGSTRAKIEAVAQLISTYNAVRAAAGGVGAGSAVAIGSWSLVSIIGAASTGTAISSLTGVAATNATLAWFGGGALAAGGAGMAGGALMLGGLALVPLVAFATWRSRSKINKVESEMVRVGEETKRVILETGSLRRDEKLADEKRRILHRLHDDLVVQLDLTRETLFPSLVSRLMKFMKKTFGMVVFDDAELDTVKDLQLTAGQLAALFRI